MALRGLPEAEEDGAGMAGWLPVPRSLWMDAPLAGAVAIGCFGYCILVSSRCVEHCAFDLVGRFKVLSYVDSLSFDSKLSLGNYKC